jgi:hypothetical protein
MTKQPPQYTTRDVATMLNANQRTIQGIVRQYNIGVLFTRQLRLYTEDDIHTIRQHYRGKPGRPRKEVTG